MKKIIPFCCCILFSYFSIAQNVGISNATPQFPLSFNGALGDKISLWTDGTPTHYGFGIQSSLFQVFSKTVSDDIAFGYGSSTAFTERMRIKGNGNVGIGTTNPQKNLSVQNGMNVDQADGNTGSAVNAITFGSNSGEGIGSKRNAGGNRWGLDFYTNSTNKMSITNGGNVGIGTTGPSAKLHVSSGDASVALFGPNSYGGMLYIGASPTNYSAASTAQVIASDGNLHIDPALNKNIYIGYYQPRDIYMNPGGVGKVGIGTTTPAASLEVNGYTKLGSDAPSVKFKKLTGITAATEAGSVNIAHGLNNSKILSLSIIVIYYAPDNNITGPNWAGSGFNFYWFVNAGNIVVVNQNGDSANILSKPIKVLITYEE